VDGETGSLSPVFARGADLGELSGPFRLPVKRLFVPAKLFQVLTTPGNWVGAVNYFSNVCERGGPVRPPVSRQGPRTRVCLNWTNADPCGRRRDDDNVGTAKCAPVSANGSTTAAAAVFDAAAIPKTAPASPAAGISATIFTISTDPKNHHGFQLQRVCVSFRWGPLYPRGGCHRRPFPVFQPKRAISWDTLLR